MKLNVFYSILTLVCFLYNSKKMKIRFKEVKYSTISRNILTNKHLVSITVTPDLIESNEYWNITYSSNSVNHASNSRIGVFHYGQDSMNKNSFSYIDLKKMEGTIKLKSPEESGAYDIRYIQDNNFKSVASIGPVYVNPKDTKIAIYPKNGMKVKPQGEVTIKYSIGDQTADKACENGNIMYFCLNIIGDYTECLWKNKVGQLKGMLSFKVPNSAGYYIVRIISEVKEDNIVKTYKTVSTSKIFQVSNDEFLLTPDTLEGVISSRISATWACNNPDEEDWVGLFSLSSKIFSTSDAPIKSKKINKMSSGTIGALLPPNSQSGPFVFVYFNNRSIVSVSDIINVQQPRVTCPKKIKKTQSNIKHIIIICTENHSFDSYFGNYCKAEYGSDPSCNYGAKCCEKPPGKIKGHSPVVLDDIQNMNWDPAHNQECELCEINGGKMDKYVAGCKCSNPQNFAVADDETVQQLFDYAHDYSISDRFFHPNAGASCQNNMYLARASYVFEDNKKVPTGSVGSNNFYFRHLVSDEFARYYDPSITSLLAKCGVGLKTYAEGYENAEMDFVNNPEYPHGYDPSDIPFNYYAGVTDDPKHITDYNNLESDLSEGKLPEVSFIKPIGSNTAHPGSGKISNEMNFIKKTVDSIMNSAYKNDTLVVWFPDESGGFYDHIPTPQANIVDDKPYGARVPFIAFGRFVKKNYISHVTLEHSSIVKFIEWNWLNGETGQMNVRDTNVNNIGDLIDSHQAGVIVPI